MALGIRAVLLQRAASAVRRARLPGLRFERCFGSPPEFEHSGDGAIEHLRCAAKGGFTRSNFIRASGSSKRLTDCYELADRVGQGAFGAVCAGRDRKTGQEVAIKTIPKDSVHDAQALYNEVEFLRVADHPNVSRLFEVFEDDGHIHLVMELCSGGELWKRILSAHECGLVFSEAELASATWQMLRAVAYCHSKSIVHRDIKPENFMFASTDKDAPLKLIDFGIGGVVPCDRPEARYLTAMVGTDGYMAPEVLLSKPYGAAADLFSVGAVMHAAIVGLPPRWVAEKQAYTFPGRMRWRMLSDGAQSLLGRLLHEDPAARPSAVEALQDPWLLERHTTEAEGNSLLASPELTERLKSFTRRSKLERATRMALVAMSRLRSEESKALQAAFLEADVICSGEVTPAELSAVLHRRRVAGQDVESLEEVFTCLDSTLGGGISCSEWMAAAASQAWLSDSNRARQAFDVLDADGDGFISASEIEAALPGVYTTSELAKEIERLDSDGDGNLNFQEFCAIFQESAN
ncbi:unnamed protein product [Polarella glacialis]|uniref:non-specific serine/threonine protein kinase n=1 Tax=Polarella glacialis TaxID=89957 RepID=A0A813I743_POLGL|nr:unnamed protein product [Polarella glacialis]